MQQPRTFLIPKSTTRSIHLQHDRVPHFYDLLHCHGEVQLSLIARGRGMFTIAGQLGRFAEGEVYLLGSNVPHVFRNDQAWYEDQTQAPAEMYSVFFGKDGLLKSLELPEFQAIRDLLHIAQRGLKLKAGRAQAIQTGLPELWALSPAARVIRFLQMLDTLSGTGNWEPVSSQVSPVLPRQDDYERLNDLFNFLMENFTRPVKLEEVAAVVHLSPAAFCRFFKQRTRKTFVEYLNEIRVNHACRMLVESDMPVGEICYACGFNNLANFNRQFRRISGTTPLHWRRKNQKPAKMIEKA